MLSKRRVKTKSGFLIRFHENNQKFYPPVHKIACKIKNTAACDGLVFYILFNVSKSYCDDGQMTLTF